MLNIVDRSITAERLGTALTPVFAAGRRAATGAADGQHSGVYFPSPATVLRRYDGYVVYPAGDAVPMACNEVRPS